MTRSSLLSAVAFVIAVIGAFAFASHEMVRPASARSFTAAPIAYTCTTTRACVTVNQTGIGDGLLATSTNSDGIHGKTSFNSQTLQSATAGVVGVDTTHFSLNAGVLGESHGGLAGVFGRGLGRTAFNGNFGLWGETVSPSASATSGFGGIVGFDLSTDGNSGDYGIAGYSPNGTGVLGHSLNDVSIEGAPSGRYFVTNGGPNITTGVIGAAPVGGAFLSLDTTGKFPTLLVQSGFGSELMRGVGPTGSSVMSLDSSGNMVLAGSLTQNGMPHALQRTASGATVQTYGGEQAGPTIEDVGQAHLIDGQTYVRLDPSFASTLDSRAPYEVFVTPAGPSRGLYVTSKSLSGFEVLENPGGRSTLAFDYRVVGRPLSVDSRFRPSSLSSAIRINGSKSVSNPRTTRAHAQ